MAELKRVLLLISIMAIVGFAAGGVTIFFLYNTAFEEEKSRLVEIAKSQARLIEAVARFDKKFSGADNPEGAAAATISQIADAHSQYEGFGETGEFTLARREGETIVFLLSHRHYDLDKPKLIPFHANLAEPMKQALSGLSGWMIGLDYRGMTVLAAYEPVAVLDLGIVAKIDLSEIRAPFLRASGIVTLIWLVLVSIGTVLFLRVGKPILQRIQESEERYKNLFQNAEVSLWNEDLSEVSKALKKLRLDGVSDLRQYLQDNEQVAWDMADLVKVVQVNEASLNLFGAKAEDEFVNLIDKSFGRKAIEVFIDELCAIWNKQQAFRSEATFRTLDGKDVNAIISFRIPEKEDGFRSIPVTIIDITERKLAEEALRKSESSLAEAQRIAQLGNWDLNLVTGKLYWSDEVFRIFSVERGDFDATTANFYRRIPPRERERVRQATDSAINDRKPFNLDHPILLPDGEERIVHEQAEVEYDESGKPVFIRGTVQDVTSQRQTEAALRHAQKMEAVGQLTGGIAHDFNNLLAVIQGNAELLGDKSEIDVKRLQAILWASRRGAELTNRLLAFSRQTALAPIPVDVSGLIGGLHDLLGRTLGETIDLRLDSTADLWPATIDPHQFENALINLMVNARDAMPKGGTLTIETANVALDETYAARHEEVMPGDYVLVAVSDSGAGMPQEVLEKAFDPFFTTKGVGEGTGLGLSMIYGFIKQSKGHITIYSEVDRGTTVKLYMPRSEEAAIKPEAEDEVVVSPQGIERILVVEDDPQVRKIPVEVLRNHGYEVVEAENGKKAIDHLKTGQTFDLLFTDVVLPGGMNGAEIALEAKRLQPNIKVLFTSGHAKNAFVHSGQLGPGMVLLTKPYQQAELLEKVRAILDSAPI